MFLILIRNDQNTVWIFIKRNTGRLVSNLTITFRMSGESPGILSIIVLATSFTQASISFCFSKLKHTRAFMQRVISNIKPGKCISISLFNIIISIFRETF